jgi:serine phosphatase RsbU (regulator of sigma subunit)
MLQRALRHLLTLAVLLGASSAVRGQEPAPVEVRAAPLAEAGALSLVFAWRYHSGDDPRWADPALDDSGWELVEPLLTPGGKLPRGGWRGTGWFRRHLRVERALWNRPLVIRIKTPGATQVFLDGSPLMDATAAGGVWREVVFSPRTDHVLAVRHTVSLAGGPLRSGDPGFHLSIERTDATAIGLASERRSTTRLALRMLVPAFLAGFLALLHLSLFLSYPKARENLFYALAMAACAVIFLSDLRFARATSATEMTVALRLVTSSALAATFFGLLTYYALRARAFPRTWIAFAALGVALMSWAVFHPNPPFDWIWNGYLGLMAVAMIHVEASGRTVRREGLGIVLAGFVVLIAVFALQLLILLELAPPIAGGSIYGFGILAMVLAMSLFLARSFARTSLHLERRLDEVNALSETVLAQERAAHEQELRRCLLEAENARKTSEIEAARTLQLSMLPATLPAVEGLETAAAMVTASEVGGDYYDFRCAPDGSLVVAFGDATGHGVAAGIMVTAVKALFSTLGGGESLSAVLAECDRVLREMQVKPLHMCLTLARLTPRSVTLCSAAMPPVLIHRAGSGEVEELGTGGRPVGSRLSGCWNESSASLSPGDTLLFASDGFAEQLDPADNPLGYERLAEVFRASAGVPARELVERLLARVTAWRGEREQSDDITLVVVRATG